LDQLGRGGNNDKFAGKSGKTKMSRIISGLDPSKAMAMMDNLNVMDNASASILNQLRGAQKQASYLIDPRNSKFLPYWDGITSFCLLYVAIVTPYEVGFLEASGTVSALFVINRLLDIIFFFDMCVQFFVMYQQGESGRWANTFGETSRNYGKGWFIIDFGSLLPSIFDIIPVVTNGQASQAATGQEGEDSMKAASGLRVLRIARLAKMIKLVRVSRLLTRWQTEYPMPFATLTVVQLTVLILFSTHWFACILGLASSLVGDGSLVTSWYATHGWCWLGGDPFPGGDWNVQCASSEGRYIAAVDWGLGLVTGLSPDAPWGQYKPFCAVLMDEDPLRSPDCGGLMLLSERLMRMTLLLCGALIWSYVIARFVEVIVSMNPDAKAFRNSIDELNRFVAIQGIDNKLARRLREYMIKSKHVSTVRSYQRVYSRLSGALRGEVALEVNKKWFKQIHLLRAANERLCVQVACALQGGVFAPSEYMPSTNLYLLHRGVAFINGQCLGGGKAWGLNSMMYSALLKRSSAIAFTYCEVYFIEGLWLREMSEVCDTVTSKRIKVWAAFNAMKQHILAHLVEHRAEQAKSDPVLAKQLAASKNKKSSWNFGVATTGKENESGKHAAAMPTEEANLSRQLAKLGNGMNKQIVELSGDVATLNKTVQRLAATFMDREQSLIGMPPPPKVQYAPVPTNGKSNGKSLLGASVSLLGAPARLFTSDSDSLPNGGGAAGADDQLVIMAATSTA